ncbi:MAG: class I SAM-dependent methyltransferase [Acidimicrobiales bacterium]|nr:class I SAM-dependent methyltransferase [Acidimicrobiales bacterium]
MLKRYTDLKGKTVIDVGGGAGYFTAAFLSSGARCVAIEPFEEELLWRGIPKFPAIVGDGYRLPIRSSSIDIAFSSNVLEHVERPWEFMDEQLRVVKPGGLVFACFTNWYSPWGGHETSPWHLLGGKRALERYEGKYNKRVKNRIGESLFPIHINSALDYLSKKQLSGDIKVLNVAPRYYPDWASFIVKIQGLREVMTWNLAMTIQKK